MSDERHNNMSSVMNATPDIQAICEYPAVKYATIDTFYRKYYEHRIHHFKEEHPEKYITNWKVTQYAVEEVAYGINYFLKVCIGHGLYIHIRVHRRKNQNKYDFYALHEIIKHNNATCIFTEDEPLIYFNY